MIFDEKNLFVFFCLVEIYLKVGWFCVVLEYVELVIWVNFGDLGLSFIYGNCLVKVGKLEEVINVYVKYMGYLEVNGVMKNDIYDV